MSGGCGCRGGHIGREVVNIRVICELFTEEYVGWGGVGMYGCVRVVWA